MGPIDIQSHRSRTRILVADDDHMIADTLAMIFVQHGYDAVAVYDGRQAIVRAHQWRPEIFLGDIVMPAATGVEAAIEISGMLPGCRTLLISGDQSSWMIIRAASERGYNFEYLEKPIAPPELLNHVDQLRRP